MICQQLRNRFLVLRHGQSVANVQGLIASSPEVAVEQFGLTEIGRQQVGRSLSLHRETLGEVATIFTSDFRRTRETAAIAAEMLGVAAQPTVALRERGFGDWDAMSDQHYETVWTSDAADPAHERWNVESVAAVAKRMTEFVTTVDETSVGQTYLLVSHGDPLQILLTAANGRDLRQHRQLAPLRTAELRSLCQSLEVDLHR